MTRDEFQTHLNRLISVYGDRAYPPERAQLLWRDVNALSGHWFAGAVDQLISSARQAPLSAEFGPLIGQERERVAKLDKERKATRGEKLTYDCDFCRDNGVYLCTLNGDRTTPYGFRCHCKCGAGDPRRFIPQYKREHADQGFQYYELAWARGGA